MKTSANKFGKITGITVLSLLLFINTSVFSQNGTLAQQKKEKIEAQKVAFITQKLNLTPDESQKFWPVYNEFEAQKETLAKSHRQAVKGFKNIELNDAQADSLITADIEFDQSMLDLRKAYISKFKSVLPAAKVARLPEAERDFRAMLLKLIKEQKKANIQK
jgi:hypothetical protein